MVYCSTCGQENPDSAKVCCKCGNACSKACLNAVPAALTMPVAPATAPAPNGFDAQQLMMMQMMSNQQAQNAAMLAAATVSIFLCIPNFENYWWWFRCTPAQRSQTGQVINNVNTTAVATAAVRRVVVKQEQYIGPATCCVGLFLFWPIFCCKQWCFVSRDLRCRDNSRFCAVPCCWLDTREVAVTI